jgi:Transcription factor WhiB
MTDVTEQEQGVVTEATTTDGFLPAVAETAVGNRWRAFAACRGIDAETFFDEESWPDARRVCAGCPVRSLCLQWALIAEEEFGLYGGLSPRERELAASGRPAGREELVEVCCSVCDHPVSWPLEPVPVEGADPGEGCYSYACEPDGTRLLVDPATARDLRNGFRLRCRNGHVVGRPTAPRGRTLIGFDLDSVVILERARRFAAAG